MRLKKSILKIIPIVIVAAFLLQAASCGTILYPERRGRTSGRIDPSVAILDGVACLLFIIPGLVAFAVDFSTGAIYLPGSNKQAGLSRINQLQGVEFDINSNDKTAVEALMKTATGRNIDLSNEELHVYRTTLPGLKNMSFKKLDQAL